MLASASPRRAELLAAAGYRFRVVEPRVAEAAAAAGLSPHDGVVAIARAKAVAVDAGTGDGGGVVVLGADTVVLCAGFVLGKPRTRGHATALLRLQSGQVVVVLTGVCVATGSQVQTATSRTQLTLRRLTDADIHRYLETGEADDKAGALAVQGAARGFVTDIDGSWSNVLGLPIEVVEPLLARVGINRSSRGQP